MRAITSFTHGVLLPALILALAFCLPGSGQAAGLLTPVNGSLEKLEIRDHHVEVVIEDGYAITMDDFGDDADIRQAIVDLSTEYGLVTDYTSMVVLREEVFETHGIERQNRQRVEVEAQAQQQRAAQPATSKRADSKQPMFNAPRPSHGGGGSFELTALLLMAFLLIVKLSREVIRRKILEQ